MLIPDLVRNPLDPDAQFLIAGLVERRREKPGPATVSEIQEEHSHMAGVAEAAGRELESRRLIVVQGRGLLALLRFPQIGRVQARGLDLSLAAELAQAGGDPSGLDEALSELDAAEVDGISDHVATAIEKLDNLAQGDAALAAGARAAASAHRGEFADALQAARQAAAALSEAGAISPMLARLAAWASRVLLAIGNSACPELAYALPHSENDAARQLFEQGLAAELSRNRHRARELYVQALREDPGYHLARCRYAEVLHDMGETEAAVAEMQRLAEAVPTLAHAHLLTAFLLIDAAAEGREISGWPDVAQAALQRARQLAAQGRKVDVGWLELLQARLELLVGDAPAAEEAARRAIAAEPSRADAYAALAEALAQQGKLAEAAEAAIAALLADHEHQAAANLLFHLRQSPALTSSIPHPHAVIDQTWQ